ncbi:CRN domain-containing -containing [Brachionus plicatilis]|uniref:CRN domain-containing-containing n=1 Tax=Brachionus plicatilis TaxID=10195 RepID=A0A3M7Q1D4_BRAPC|nr:CRN domain-containing -containing [Brachionus plicatilis]
MVLQYNEKKTKDCFLKKAITIANLFLKTSQANLIFKDVFEIDYDFTQSKMNDLKISYFDSKDCFGMTKRDSAANKIYINSIFCKRFTLLEKSIKIIRCAKIRREKRNEIKIIVFFIGTIIIHETGHLLLRWKGILDSPPKTILEAGEFIEKKLFGDCLHLIKRTGTDWNEFSKYIGIACPNASTKVKKDGYVQKLSFKEYINEFFGEKIPDSLCLTPILEEYRLDKHDTVFKLIDEQNLTEKKRLRGLVFFDEDFGEVKCRVKEFNPLCEKMGDECNVLIDKMVSTYLKDPKIKNKIYLIPKFTKKKWKIVNEVEDKNSKLHQKWLDFNGDEEKMKQELNILLFND